MTFSAPLTHSIEMRYLSLMNSNSLYIPPELGGLYDIYSSLLNFLSMRFTIAEQGEPGAKIQAALSAHSHLISSPIHSHNIKFHGTLLARSRRESSEAWRITLDSRVFRIFILASSYIYTHISQTSIQSSPLKNVSVHWAAIRECWASTLISFR